ncbi:MAG: hypothetical protein WA962_06320 [Ornithinimicrobium sp.]
MALVVCGQATPLGTWPGLYMGCHAIRIDADGAALYWDAAEPVTGPVDLVGEVEFNNVDTTWQPTRATWSAVLVDLEVLGTDQ